MAYSCSGMNLEFIKPQNLLMKSSQSNLNLRSQGSYLVRSYLITTVKIMYCNGYEGSFYYVSFYLSLDLVKTLLFCNTACFSICQKWKVIFEFDQDIQRDICQTRSPFKAFKRVEYVVRENQNRTAKWVRHNRVKLFLMADLFCFSCTVLTRFWFLENWILC